MLKPQLPIMAVVTPCQEDGDIVGSKWACASKWVWMSTKPGVTMHPVASISETPTERLEPMNVITPLVTSTSAANAGTPVPSITLPPRMMRSGVVMKRFRSGMTA
ncbi:unannotated protein [freshwater metagenome]|uniref:Unannotated protein n=1 Tax=freshwater metagenome TaxID=449393 RepID=A0A6J5YFJ7_9ZZZZ